MTTTINGSAGVITNSGAVYDSLQMGTAVSVSGTSIDFTSIPSWVKRITVIFSGVSTSGTSRIQIQLGTSSGIEATGYAGTTTTTSITTGIPTPGAAASHNRYGHIVFTAVSGNSWVASGIMIVESTDTAGAGGGKTLSGTLDRLRITTVNGTDTFDAGTINIIYE